MVRKMRGAFLSFDLFRDVCRGPAKSEELTLRANNRTPRQTRDSRVSVSVPVAAAQVAKRGTLVGFIDQPLPSVGISNVSAERYGKMIATPSRSTAARQRAAMTRRAISPLFR